VLFAERGPSRSASRDRFYKLHNLIPLTPWSLVLLEKPTVAQLLKNFLTFYGTRRFITVFTRARQRVPILSQMNPVHTTPSYSSEIHFNTILQLVVVSFFLSGFLSKTLYALCFNIMCATCPAILLDIIILIIFGEGYKKSETSWCLISVS
jgi:hypothetical protein